MAVFADRLLNYSDSGAGPIPGPYGFDNLGNFPVLVNANIIVDENPTVGALSLPTGSSVTVAFSNVLIRDQPGYDLSVLEDDDVGEQAEVYVTSFLFGSLLDNIIPEGSTLDNSFVLLGTANAGTTSNFDLASIGFTGQVQAVKIVGLDNKGASPGFDLVNVQALQPILQRTDNLTALQPEWNSENSSLRYGFEVENANDFIAQNVEVGLYFADNGNIISEIPVTSQLNPEIEGNQIWYDLPIKDIPLELSNEDLNANQIAAIVDPKNLIEEQNEDDNQQSIDYYFVRDIPQIMRNIGEAWDVPASFQERWLNGKETIVEPPPNEAAFEANPTIEPISLEWILQDNVDTDNRAQKAFDRLTDVNYLFNDAGSNVLARKLNESLKDEPVGTVINFGVEGTSAEALSNRQTQLSPVVTQPSVPPTNFELTPLDPLLGALGNFSFYAIPIGEAEKLSNDEIRVTATGVDIYALDVFEFGGDQFLGFWNPPDEASRSDILGTYVSNGTYGDYREQTGLGEDFITLSNVVEEPLKSNGLELLSSSFTLGV
jgi:hypothetical protein